MENFLVVMSFKTKMSKPGGTPANELLAHGLLNNTGSCHSP